MCVRKIITFIICKIGNMGKNLILKNTIEVRDMKTANLNKN